MKSYFCTSPNYGLIEYVDWNGYQANTKHLANPIIYTYLKDNKYQAEQELRISLSTFGMGKFVLQGEEINFPRALPVAFNFKTAIANGIIHKIEHSPDCDATFFIAELQKLGIDLVSEP